MQRTKKLIKCSPCRKNCSIKALAASAAFILAFSSSLFAAGLTFTAPVAGTVTHVGDTLHIAFVLDSGIQIRNHIMGVSVDSGMGYAILPLIMNGTAADTVTAKQHYDWPVPAFVEDEFGSHPIDNTVSTNCKIKIFPYPSGGGSGGASGTTGIFTIEASNSILSPFSQGLKTNSASLSLVRSSASRPILQLNSGISSTAFIYSANGQLRNAMHVGPGATRLNSTASAANVIIKLNESTGSAAQF